MSRDELRKLAGGFSLKILKLNEAEYQRSNEPLVIQNISRGGFRFFTITHFELEDRMKVELTFPDGHVELVLGRICYSDQMDEIIAYGFSVLDGFYALSDIKAVS